MIELEFRGAVARLVACRDLAVLLDGPAGTGKTRGALTKLFYACERMPKIRCLIVRETRASLTESVLKTFEVDVCPSDHPCLEGPDRAHRQRYDFPNGSCIVLGGMDVADRIMSTEFDLIFVCEATEISEDDAEKLMTRLRNGRFIYHQIIFDCNPGAPTHWLKRWADAGRCTRFPSRHEDNPRFYKGGDWTDEGRTYIHGVLGQLTGHRRARLLEGHWAAAEGLVYPEWDASVHLIDRFEIPKDWRRIRSIDFGYTNPFVCQWWAIDPDGRMYLYREIYESQKLVEDHAREIKELSAGERIEATVADHDAEGRATLDRADIGTIPAVKEVERGIQAVANRLRRAGDGKPRMFVLRGSVCRRDASLDAAKRPCSTDAEFDGYCWQQTKDGKPVKEEPVKVDDHGMDAARYAAMYLDGGASGTGLSMGSDLARTSDAERIRNADPVPSAFEAKRRQDINWGF